VLAHTAWGEGKWLNWSIMMIFLCNSLLTSVFLFATSRLIRKRVYAQLGLRHRLDLTAESTSIARQSRVRLPR